MSKVKFDINSWRKKHVLKEGVGGVVSRRAFDPIPGMFRTEAVDHVDDEEAATDYSDLEDKDLDNDGDQDASDSYLHKRQGQVAKVTEDDIFEEKLNEASIRSNIMQKWDTTTVIQNDIEEFVDRAMDAGGIDLLSKVYIALKNATEHARRVYRKG